MEFIPGPDSKLEHDGRLPDTASTWNIAHAADKLMDELNPAELGELTEVVRPEIVTERRNLERAALIDNLTQLANREAFDRARQTAEADADTSFIFVDGDKFGLINKKLGQSEGDAEIKRMAVALKDVGDRHGIGERVFRIGGDEFVILAPTDDAEAILKEAVDTFGTTSHEGFEYQGRKISDFSLSLTGAIGLTFAEAESKLVEAKARLQDQGQDGRNDDAAA